MPFLPFPAVLLRCAAALFLFTSVASAGEARLIVHPERATLTGTDPEHGLLVTLIEPDGRRSDVTTKSRFTSASPEVVTVSNKGRFRAVADGETQVEISFGEHKALVPVIATATGERPPPSFRQDIIPILTRTGCNAGGCHGKLEGQNGFRLSLRGYAPEWDHDWVTKEVSARRVNVAFPEASLLVQKPAGDVVHEGGTKFRKDSRYYETLVTWIAARAPGPAADEADAARLEVLPGDRELQLGDRQQLLVRAHYPDGRVRDVTWLAQFFSNDEATVSVKPDGAVKALRAGETSVRVHFQGIVEVVRFTMPYPTQVAPEQFAAANNVLDPPVFKKLAGLRIPPSPLCDDQTFIRRASLDAIGTLPTPEEVTAFLADERPDKRARLVDALLARPEYIDYWTLQLADLLQNRKERDHDVRGTKGVRSFHTWLREQVAANRPWDQLARDVLLASGNVADNPQIGYYITVMGEKRNVEESELPDSIAQSFLGTRIGCARCHDHPLEKYTQDDFYHFSAFFSKMSMKRQKPESGGASLATASREEQEQSKRLEEAREKLDELAQVALSIGEEPGGEEPRKAAAEQKRKVEEQEKRLAEAAKKPPGVTQPRTGKMMAPQPLDRGRWTFEAGRDAREQLVDWMFDSGRDAFAGAMVNRLWKHFFSVGLVEPVDDLRASNPPSNAELWSVLKTEFAGNGWDLKHMMRLILNSRAYQLSSSTLADNAIDSRFYSHYYARRLPAEVLTDAISAATDAPVAFAGYPVGVRAIQLPDPGVGSYFLTLFGRSERVTACACERQGEVTLPQLLHLQNSDELQKQIRAKNGRLEALMKSGADQETIDGIFLATVNRRATPAEAEAVAKALAADAREAVFPDLFWALLNSKEFTFNH